MLVSRSRFAKASIDYVRYLEDCVAKLQAENDRTNATPSTDQSVVPPSFSRDVHGSSKQYHSFGEQEDVEMGGSEQASPTYSTPVVHSNSLSASPALIPQDCTNLRDSYSSVSTDHRHYSFSASTITSLARRPGVYEYARSAASAGSALTSPALLPQQDPDREATAALLMLNSDRRAPNNSIGGRRMSVKDLLST